MIEWQIGKLAQKPKLDSLIIQIQFLLIFLQLKQMPPPLSVTLVLYLQFN